MSPGERPRPERVVVDTDVFSYIFDDDPLAERYRPHIDGRVAMLSFQTVAELLQGAYQRRWGQRRLDRQQAEMQRYMVAPFRIEMAEQFARLRAHRRSLGQEIATADAWIAATALWLECPVVTHNRRDSSNIPGLDVISEA